MGSIIASVCLAATIIAAAYLDVRFRVLPNWLCLLCAAAGLGIAISQSGTPEFLWHLAHSAIALVIGVSLFAGQIWGGGDAKFYAAVALWFPANEFFSLVWWISLAGLALVIGLLLLRRRAEGAGWSVVKGVPYGVAIGAGAAITWATSTSFA